ncbi:MAG: pyridoxamine 5'-phosphate oxidase, partial [Proteobacteria bacterium]|nr:pyridoxamine 5'-phosphate oxidase [Pseudomonadota bacterium]
FVLFRQWYAEAQASELNDPNAMALASCGPDGFPAVRIVLMKDIGERGLTFFTNRDSIKGTHLQAHPRAAINFHWKSLQRQVRAEGKVEPVSDAESDAYFATRQRQSQLGAWASQQSRPLASRAVLEQRLHEYEQKFSDQTVPRPPYWGGYCLIPHRLEFWQERPYRLHDRIVYRRGAVGQPWISERLYP